MTKECKLSILEPEAHNRKPSANSTFSPQNGLKNWPNTTIALVRWGLVQCAVSSTVPVQRYHPRRVKIEKIFSATPAKVKTAKNYHDDLAVLESVQGVSGSWCWQGRSVSLFITRVVFQFFCNSNVDLKQH